MNKHADTSPNGTSEPTLNNHFDNYNPLTVDGAIHAEVSDRAKRVRQIEAQKAAESEQQSKQEDNPTGTFTDDVPHVITLEEAFVEAYDIYLFRYNSKAHRWFFAGIYLDGVFKKLDRLGFRKRYNTSGQVLFIYEKDNLISETISARMRDAIKAYIDANTEPIGTENYTVTYAARSERHRRTSDSIYNDRSLVGLQTHDRIILQDTPDTCYIPYLNGVVVITKDSVSLEPYSSLGDICVWQGQVIQRAFDINAAIDCHFARFICNVSNNEADRIQSCKSAIGYGMHSYNWFSGGQAIICCDEELADKSKPQGGTGKGVFVNAIRQIRPCAYIDGKKFDDQNRFGLQAVNYDTRVVWIDDVKSNFSFERFFSILTSGWTIEKKNGQEFTIPYEYGPKLFICTNVAPNNEGSSNIRRQFILEFSDFYKNRIKPGQDNKPIREVHGCDFFTNDWSAGEWARFDRYMVECAHEYMRSGLVSYKTHNVSKNRLLQLTGDDFVTWAETYDEQGLQPNTVYKRPDLHLAYRTFAGVGEKECPARRFTNFVKSYAAAKGWLFELGSSNANPTFTLVQPT